MTVAVAALAGLFFAAAVYLMLSRHIIRIVLGIALLSNAVNLTIFAAGRIAGTTPPIVPPGLERPPAGLANALPQALILTAIVISFSFLVFMLVLAYRTFQTLGTEDSLGMREVAPESDERLPPLGY
jgi:multicomponent Na+:H+ antiporter subunit C